MSGANVTDDRIAEIAPPERLIEGPGTTEATWRASPIFERMRVCDLEQWVARHPHIWLVSPHPDDEILALGGALARLSALGAALSIVSVTDGTASHVGSPRWPESRLAIERPAELRAALSALAIDADVVRIEAPDGRIGQHGDRLYQSLGSRIGPQDLLLATYRHDGHPDHEATGDVAMRLASRTGATLVEYPVWMWHWARPESLHLPWHRARRIVLDDTLVRQKRRAIGAFTSQITADGDRAPILPPHVVARFLRPFEVVFV